ncbi:MAG: PAS domain S-box protein [Proteobacteria bacterium]|nr:PAS domain S-box protein [Pseudomonadota bacterium]
MNKIIVVDNDSMMLEFMSELLENKGHQVKTAKDGLAALEALKTYTPDIMFVDLVMPNISGEKLCRAIRRNPEFNGIYIVILSAIVADQEIDFTGIGANGCIAKGSFDKMSEQVLYVLDCMNNKIPDDITKKTIGLEYVHTRKINKELLSFKRHSEAILNNLSEGIFELNFNNKVIYANHFAQLLIGIREEDLLGSYFTELFEEPHRMRVKEMIDLIDTGPQEISDDQPVMLKDKMVSLRILPVNDKEYKSIIVILNDVTKRKKAEQALAEQKEFSEKMIENSAVPTFVIDTQHEVLIWNKACEELTGIKAAEMVGTDSHWKGFYDHKRPHIADIVVDRTPGSMSDYYGNYKKSAFAEEGLQAEGWYADLGGKKRYIFFDAAPIYSSKDELVGAVETLHDITDRKLFERELKMTTEKLRKNLIGTMQTISLIIETRDPYTAGHQKEVSKLARSIAQEIGLSADTIDNIRMAGAIHDIGKMAVPAEILSKPGRLTDIEMSLIKTHAESGYNILKDAELPYPVAEITLQHHERMDGSGYPNGLKGDEILLEARIICIADVVEAISSHRPYRPALGIDIALDEIEKNKGLFYDIQVADACLRLFREKGYKMGGGS